MREEIVNAQITDVTLGYEDHNILTFGLTIQFGCSGCVYGGVALDGYDKEQGERIPSAKGMQCLTEIMKVVGVRNWEDLKGKYIRVVDAGLGHSLDTIGNLMEDKWFSLEKFWEVMP